MGHSCQDQASLRGLIRPRGLCSSVAAVHDLTDEIPPAVQIAVPRSSHPPRIAFPPAAVVRFEASTFELGLTRVEAAPGESVRIYDAPRTVVDLMRLRHRSGEPTALAALHRYLRRRDARPAELLKVAAALRVYGPVLHALDVSSAGGAGQRGHQNQGAPTSTCRTAPGQNGEVRKSSSRSTSSSDGSRGSALRPTPTSS